MKYRRLLFNAPDPFDIFNTQELFVKAVKENCQYHYDHCAEYRKILDSMNFKPDSINSYDDISKIPFLPIAGKPMTGGCFAKIHAHSQHTVFGGNPFVN